MAEAVASPTLTPSPVALSTAKKRVVSYWGAVNDTDALSVAEDGIKEAIDELNIRVWNVLRTYHDITLDNTNASYAIPANYHDTRDAHFLNSSGEAALNMSMLSPEEFELRFSDRTSAGRPFAFTVFNHVDSLTLELSAVPSSGFTSQYPTLRHRYFKNIQAPTGDDQNLAMPSVFMLFVLWRAREYGAAIYDPRKATFARSKADGFWQRLMMDDNRQGQRDL